MTEQTAHHPALSRLISFVVEDDLMLEMLFEYVKVSEVQSEELATALVFLFEQRGHGHRLLQQAIKSGMEHYPNGRMLRETNFSVHVVSEYVRCWGKRYLRSVLKAPLRNLLHNKTRVEIDPKRLEPGEQVEDNLATLIELVGSIIRNITATQIPTHVDTTMRILFKSLQSQSNSLSSYLLISSFLFLRFICPAIVSPDLYGLRKKGLTKPQQRKLVLVAKIMQNIANEVVSADKQGYLSAVGGFVEESVKRVQEWTTKYLSDGLTSVHKKNEVKLKKIKIEPYMLQMSRFLTKNEDRIRKYFEQQSDKEKAKGGKGRKEYITTCETFLQHMDDIHMEIGFDPEAAESYEKVWERVQRRMQRLEKMQARPGQKPRSESVDMENSNSSSPRVAVHVWSGLFSNEEVDTTSTLTFSTGEEDTTEEMEEVKESLLARNDINPDGKVIFKCFKDKLKKMIIIPLASVSYPELRMHIVNKFSIKTSELPNLKIASERSPSSSDSYITDNSSLSRFLRTSGTISESTIVFTLYLLS